jgi:hypothetical protein
MTERFIDDLKSRITRRAWELVVTRKNTTLSDATKVATRELIKDGNIRRKFEKMLAEPEPSTPTTTTPDAASNVKETFFSRIFGIRERSQEPSQPIEKQTPSAPSVLERAKKAFLYLASDNTAKNEPEPERPLFPSETYTDTPIFFGSARGENISSDYIEDPVTAAWRASLTPKPPEPPLSDADVEFIISGNKPKD